MCTHRSNFPRVPGLQNCLRAEIVRRAPCNLSIQTNWSNAKLTTGALVRKEITGSAGGGSKPGGGRISGREPKSSPDTTDAGEDTRTPLPQAGASRTTRAGSEANETGPAILGDSSSVCDGEPSSEPNGQARHASTRIGVSALVLQPDVDEPRVVGVVLPPGLPLPLSPSPPLKKS